MTVLILTHADDEHCVEEVAAAIRARSGRSFRFDTDLFPTTTRMQVEQGPGGDAIRITTPSDDLDLDEVTAVWHRRIAIGRRIPKEMESQLRTASVDESRSAVLGTIAALGCFHLDPLTTIRHAEHKPRQLTLARASGLAIPRTLTTNDPDAVRRFAKSCPHGLVAKMLHSFAVRSGGEEEVVFTTEMTAEHLADLEGLDLCPMTFQEKVRKAVELRVTVVGRQAFAAEIASPEVVGAEIDWRRRGEEAKERWKVHALPALVEERIHGFMDRLGLNYGALDFILTPDGRYVFLEVNPSGEFSWLLVWPGLPIAEALADTLLGRVERR